MNKHHVILLVDDDSTDRELIGRAYTKIGYPFTLRTAKHAKEALSYLRGDGPFADRDEFPIPKYILCDLKMQGGDGFEFLQAMAQNPHWCTLPVIIHSGSADADDVKQAALLGAIAFFTKRSAMCEITHLLRTIYEFMDMAEHLPRNQHGEMLPTYSHNKLGQHIPHPK